MSDLTAEVLISLDEARAIVHANVYDLDDRRRTMEMLATLDAARDRPGLDVEALIAELSESPLPGARYAVTVVRNWRDRAAAQQREGAG